MLLHHVRRQVLCEEFGERMAEQDCERVVAECWEALAGLDPFPVAGGRSLRRHDHAGLELPGIHAAVSGTAPSDPDSEPSLAATRPEFPGIHAAVIEPSP